MLYLLKAKKKVPDWHREVLKDTLALEDVRDRLQLRSRIEVKSLVRRRELLAVSDGKYLRFPRWQFDESAPNGVLPGLAEALKAGKRYNGVELALWFLRTQPAFDDRSPAEVLRAGEVQRVITTLRGQP